MYELEKSAFGKYTQYHFYNPQTRTGFKIVPERAANVLDIYFRDEHILDGYQTPEELTEAKWGKSVLLFPFPNRLNNGKYQWQNQVYNFPLNNASTGNAIHGFVRDQVFEVDYVFLARDHASILCSYTYEGELESYPFPFTIEVEFMIHDNGNFTLETAVRNMHDKAIPVGFGWHPYFKLAPQADNHHMQLPACELVEIDDRMIPVGKRSTYTEFLRKKRVDKTFLDNCFKASQESGVYKMKLSGAGSNLTVKANAKQFPFFQVFTPPHRESIALEPMSCNVDAFNNQEGLVSLEPDKTWTGKISLEFAY